MEFKNFHPMGKGHDLKTETNVPRELQLLEVLAYSAQIPWQRVKAEISSRCHRLTLPVGAVIAQLAEEIRSGVWSM